MRALIQTLLSLALLTVALLTSSKPARAQSAPCEGSACPVSCRAAPDVICSVGRACVLPTDLDGARERAGAEAIARGKGEAAAAEQSAGEVQQRHLEDAYAAFRRARNEYGEACNPYVLLELGKLAQRLGHIDAALDALEPLRCTVVGDLARADDQNCTVEDADPEIGAGRELWLELGRKVEQGPAQPVLPAASWLPAPTLPIDPTDAHRQGPVGRTHPGGAWPLMLVASGSALLAADGGSAWTLMLGYLFTPALDVSAGGVVTPRFAGPRASLEGTLGDEWFASLRAGGTALFPYRLAEGQGSTTFLGLHAGIRGGYGERLRCFLDMSADVFPSADERVAWLLGAGVSWRLYGAESATSQ